MYGYDGELFETFEQFRDYLLAKYGDMGPANLASVSWWGEDLHGNYLYIDGIQQIGTEGENLANAGLSDSQAVLDAFNKDPVQFSADTYEQLMQLKQAREVTIEGTNFTNTSLQLGSGGSESGGTVLVTNRPVATGNGTVFNNPNVMTAEKDPTDPLKWIGGLRSLGGLTLPAWTVAAAPLLGVALGVGLYELNPEFWERVSRELLPYCYDDNGTPKMPISVDKSGNVHTSKNAIEKLRQIFIEEGVYSEGLDIDYDRYENTTVTPAQLSFIDAHLFQIELIINKLATLNPSDTCPLATNFTNYEVKSFLEWAKPLLFASSFPSEYVVSGRYTNPVAYDFSSFTDKYVSYAGSGFFIKNTTTSTFIIDSNGQNSTTYQAVKYDNVQSTFDALALTPSYSTVLPEGFSIELTVLSGLGYNNQPVANFVYRNSSNNTILLRMPLLSVYDTISGVTRTLTDMITATTASRAGIKRTPFNVLNNINLSTANNMFAIGSIFMGSMSSGVEGATPEPGAVYPTDTSRSLEDLYPTWYDNGIDVITNPVADLIEDAVERWVPLSLSKTNNSDNTDDVASTETQTDAQDGTNPDDSQKNQLADAIKSLTEALTRDGILPPDPTTPTDPSGETPTPTPPVITGAGSDLIAIYNPTKAQIQAFNQFLWDLDPTNLVNWKKVIANPIDAVISLHMIYVTPITGESRHIKCGYIETDVSSKIVTNQYVDIDCGTVEIGEYFHNVWDYMATTIEIYLPFIGIVPIHVSDVMNSTIKVRYRVDVLTGACLAQIIVYKGNSWGTLYTYAGNCAVPLPLTSGSFTGVFSSLLATAGTAVFGGGAAMAAGALTGTVLKGGIRQNIQRSGSIGSNVGALGIRTPYVIVTRKIPLDAYLYETQYGFPANKTVSLGSMHGYTRVKDIHLSGIPCTDDELEQIEALLKDGVIIN